MRAMRVRAEAAGSELARTRVSCCHLHLAGKGMRTVDTGKISDLFGLEVGTRKMQVGSLEAKHLLSLVWGAYLTSDWP